MTSTWMPLYIGDYLKKTMHLSAEEHGAYLLLIMNYWCNGKITDDRENLQNISKLPYKVLEKNVLKFFKTADGFLTHDRIDKEQVISLELKQKKSEAGKKGMDVRYQKPNTPPNKTPNKDLTDYITEGLTKSNQSPSPSHPSLRSEKTPPSDEGGPPVVATPFQKLIDVWNQTAGEKLPKVKELSEARKKTLRLRYRELGSDQLAWQYFCLSILESDFLTGKNDRGWSADFDWCVMHKNFIKIREGNYGNDRKKHHGNNQGNGGTARRDNIETLRAARDNIHRDIDRDSGVVGAGTGQGGIGIQPPPSETGQ